MARKVRTNDKTAEIAAPVREFLRLTIKKKLSSPQEKQKLAKFLGQAPTSVSNLLKGEGGLDTWVAALVFCYGMDANALIELGQNFQALVKKYQPSESDRIAAQIQLPENKRKLLFSALLTALTIDEEVAE